MPQDDAYPKNWRAHLDAMRVPASCHTCAHRRFTTLGCDAFPDEIPPEIIRGRHDHKTPYAGDRGVMYEPMRQRPQRTKTTSRPA
jgi:hypothetical protein